MRSKLFVPGSRPELFAKALAGAADALSFDLEDAVVEERKTEARVNVANCLREAASATEKTLIVRVNAMTTPHFVADVAAVAVSGLGMLNVPKVEDPAQVAEAAALLSDLETKRGLGAISLLVNIESPEGLRRVLEIARAHPRVAGLQIGFGDLLISLGMQRDPAMLAHVRIAVRLAAAGAGIPAYDSAFVDIADRAGFAADAEAARRLGFAGKSCIHPSQVEAANTVFAPTRDEIGNAMKVIYAARSSGATGTGAFIVDGRMVDLPFVRQAEAVLKAAGDLGLLPPEHRRETETA